MIIFTTDRKFDYPGQNRHASYEEAVLPHLSEAYNLARSLTRNVAAAEDLVQESCLRALRFFSSFQGGSGRAWLLTIVRNTWLNWLRHNRTLNLSTTFDSQIHDLQEDRLDPEALMVQKAENEVLRRSLAELPSEFRDVLIMREWEELSYKEIAEVSDIPIGTVMSRLSRARKRLQERLNPDAEEQVRNVA